MPEHDDSFDLVMPFVCVASVGGPYDDRAFAAGVTFGTVRAALMNGPAMVSTMIPTDLIAQVDLVAMEQGYDATVDGHLAGDEWVCVAFKRSEPSDAEAGS